MRYALILWLLAASLLLAEDPYDARWAELRQRIANGGDVGQLLNQWESAKPAAPLGKLNTARPLLPARTSSFPLLDIARDKVRVAACERGVRPALALAIVDHETGFNNSARGEKGEIGAGQIMPATAMKFGFDTHRLATDYEYNVRSAVDIMRSLLDYFNGDEQAAIRGYNGGPGWQNAGPATRGQIEHYAASVTGLRSKYVPVTCG